MCVAATPPSQPNPATRDTPITMMQRRLRTPAATRARIACPANHSPLPPAIPHLTVSSAVPADNRLLIGQPRVGRSADVSSASMPSSPFRMPPPLEKAQHQGIRSAWETAAFIPVGTSAAEREAVRALTKRPRYEWMRSFDTSFWLDGNALKTADGMVGGPGGAPKAVVPDTRLLSAMVAAAIRGEPLERSRHEAEEEAAAASDAGKEAEPEEEEAAVRIEVEDATVRAWVVDRYTDPKTGRHAMTVRTAVRSADRPIDREDAMGWQRLLREELKRWSLQDGGFEIRG